MKIIDSAFLPLVPEEASMETTPEACLSTTQLEPSDSSLFSRLTETTDTVLAATTAVPEFGEFLLDAVDWL